MKNIKIGLNKLISTGFFHIFGSNVLNKIMQFCSGIFIVRILTQTEYGLYTYSQNLLSFFILMNGFGIMSGLMQFGVKSKSSQGKDSYLKYSIKISIVSSFVLICLIGLYALYGNFSIEEARSIFAMMILLPVTQLAIEIIQIKNRIEFRNKEMAFISNLNTGLSIFFMIIGGAFFKLPGVIIGRYLGDILPIILFSKDIKSVLLNWNSIDNLSKEQKKEINKFSIISMINNGFSQLVYIIGVFLIGQLLVSQSDIAIYKTGTLVPTALNFIPSAMMIYLYPYFAKKSEDKEWVFEKYKKTLLTLGVINLIITLFLIIFSKYIILILFGEQYLESMSVFIILSIGYFFTGTFRIPTGNLLASMGLVKYNLYNTIICGILTVFLNIKLIDLYGINGAAMSTVLIFIISGLISNITIFVKVRPNNL